MNEKYYVIVSGEYSDWVIRGVALSEEEAVNICCQHNQAEVDEDGYVDDRWYYKETGGLSQPEELKPAYIRYRVMFSRGKYSRTDIDFGVCEQKNSYTKSRYGWEECLVYLDEWNEDKAFKIACDLRAEALAKDAEIAF